MRSKRESKETNLGDYFYTFLVDDDPRSYKEAMTSANAPLWKEAINSEIESIMHNHTWEIVDLPLDAKTIGCKWIFKMKLKLDGSIEKYKACKEQNISNYGYISTWILRIYRKYR